MGLETSSWEASLGPFADALLTAARAAGMGIAVTLVDEEQPRNVFASDGLAEILGCSRTTLLERAPLSFVAPEDADRMRAAFGRRRDGDQAHVRAELTIVRPDGVRVPVEISVGGVTLNGRLATVAFVTDITERRRAEQTARRGEASFRELIEAVPEAIGIMRHNRFVYANPAYVKLLGYESLDALCATPLDQLVDPEESSLVRSRESRVLAFGQTLPPQTYRAIRRDGAVVLLEITSVPFVYEGSAAALGIARDVTERKRMEAQLLQADRLASLGTLAAGVAHEVNNPLGYLTLNLEWLARQLPTLASDPSRLQALALMLEEARHGAARVAAIVRDLRAFSRADGETRNAVDLRTTVGSAIKMAGHHLRHRASVVTEFEDDVPAAWANEARLEQVLLNLLLNAAQAMDESTMDRNEIGIVVRKGAPSRAIIEVTDNGAGISPQALRHIFDPFFTTKSNGTGLGLSICHTIVTSFGGTISVSSRVGEGTTFRIELPTRSQVADSTRPPASGVTADAPFTKRLRILVVDDEAAIASTLRELLAAEHDVKAVTSGAEALEAVRASTFDVILCDLMMPQMSGMDLYDRLREASPGLERRVVFMTGGAFTARATEFLARVPNRRVEKPFALSAIEQAVRAVARRTAATAS